MRRTVFIISSALILIVLIPVGVNTCKFVKYFESLNDLELDKKPYDLNVGFIVAMNVRTKSVDTIKFEGKHIINFWATWCKPCIEELPSLEKLRDSFPEYGVLMFSFDSLTSQQRFLSQSGSTLSIPAYFIKDTLLFKEAELLPKTYILRDSTVVREIFGMKDWQDSTNTKDLN